MMIWKYGDKKTIWLMFGCLWGEAMGNLLFSYVVSQFILAATERDLSRFWTTLWVGLIGFSLFGSVRYFSESVQIRVVQQINQRIKKQVVRKMSQQPNGRTELVAFLTNDLKQLETSGVRAEITIMASVCTVVVALIGSLCYDPLMTLVFLGTAFLPSLVNQIWQGKIAATSADWQEANQQMLTSIRNFIGGYRTLLTYHAQANMLKQSTEKISIMEGKYAKMNQRIQLANSIMLAVAWISSITLPFGLGMYFVIQKRLDLAAFMGVVQLSNSFVNPVMTIFQMKNQLATTSGINEKVASMMTRVKVAEVKGNPAQINSLSFKQARVVVSGKERLGATTLTIQANEKILIKAPSGFGKSTLLEVIQGQVALSAGEYRVNQWPVETVNPEWLQAQFGYIQQNPAIFSGTLKFNLTLGEAYTEVELKQVVEAAQLKGVIADKGWDYLLAEEGNSLSGGQRQRLEIARALLRKRPFLLVDEGTSALDAETAKAIRETLSRYPGTVIEVAHHVTAAEERRFTRIIHLEDGTSLLDPSATSY